MNIFFGFVFIISKIWIWIINKFNFMFIRIESIGKIIFYCGIGFLIIINIVLIFVIWISKKLMLEEQFLVFYFAMPWLIIILANTWGDAGEADT
jgi:hypothetical protein